MSWPALLAQDSSDPRLTAQIEFYLRNGFVEPDPVAQSVIPSLTELLNHTNAQVRAEAAAALDRIAGATNDLRGQIRF